MTNRRGLHDYVELMQPFAGLGMRDQSRRERCRKHMCDPLKRVGRSAGRHRDFIRGQQLTDGDKGCTRGTSRADNKHFLACETSSSRCSRANLNPATSVL